MRKTIRIAITVVIFGGIALLALHSKASANLQSKGVQNQQDDLDCAISEFNDRIQDRFKAVDRDFGYRRIIRPFAHNFRPENAREIKDVDGITNAGQTLFLYLTDLEVLGPPNPSSTGDKNKDAKLNDIFMKNAIKGPALITGDQKLVSDLPTVAQLWEPSAKALKSFEHNESYDFTLNGWNISARPVRASQESCMQCHLNRAPNRFASIPVTMTVDGKLIEDKKPAEIKIGDPLGVVIYAFRRTK
ncbi:MAG TPA: hypothetical protein VFC63_06005 [Blastocatellia bacterium]|nr:hypothetical protein [Blastocatellia bacterium]